MLNLATAVFLALDRIACSPRMLNDNRRSLLQLPHLRIACDVYLSRCRDALPKAEIADQIDQQETQAHVPLDGSESVDSSALMKFQHVATNEREAKK